MRSFLATKVQVVEINLSFAVQRSYILIFSISGLAERHRRQAAPRWHRDAMV